MSSGPPGYCCGHVLRHTGAQGPSACRGLDSGHVHGVDVPAFLPVYGLLWRRGQSHRLCKTTVVRHAGTAVLLLALLLFSAKVHSHEVRCPLTLICVWHIERLLRHFNDFNSGCKRHFRIIPQNRRRFIYSVLIHRFYSTYLPIIIINTIIIFIIAVSIPNGYSSWRVFIIIVFPFCVDVPFDLYTNFFYSYRKHLRHLRILVLQLPVVQGFVYMVLLVMWAEEEVFVHLNNIIYLGAWRTAPYRNIF